MSLLDDCIIEEYRAALPALRKLSEIVVNTLEQAIEQASMEITTIKARIKTEESLRGKLTRKGNKYHSLDDLTDILGARVITYYTDDVDRIAAIVEKLFDVDWENSVDKRRLHQLDSFGYNSLHYICRLPKQIAFDPQMPELNTIRFELQLRTTIQHAWATLNHDIGYKSGIEVPAEYLRSINRLAGMLELADDEFSRIRTEINAYRHRMMALVSDGKLDEVPLDSDSFRSYLQTRPFDSLNNKIAAINQAELMEVPMMEYLPVLKKLDCHTLGDVERFKQQYTPDAYWLARHQIGNTNIDILASSIGLQNLCIVCILQRGGGKLEIQFLFDAINGASPQNEALAELTLKQAQDLPFNK